MQVSWKADGTRYMMLVDGEDEVYFIDRDNCVYQVIQSGGRSSPWRVTLDQVSGLTFLHRKHQDRHIQVSRCLWYGGREYRGVVVYPSMWSSTPWSPGHCDGRRDGD